MVMTAVVNKFPINIISFDHIIVSVFVVVIIADIIIIVPTVFDTNIIVYLTIVNGIAITITTGISPLSLLLFPSFLLSLSP